jgi:putative zinc finger/helix-turn-helix YgiT family protein
MKCPNCGTGDIELKRVMRPYDAGLPDILVDGLEHGECPSCGEVVSGVPRSLELGNMVLTAIIGKRSSLAGNEIRYLRRSLGLKSSELGERLAVNEQQVSRWETGKRPMAAAADRLLRMLVAMEYDIAAPDLASIDHTLPTAPLPLHVELGRRGWKVVQPRAKTARAA